MSQIHDLNDLIAEQQKGHGNEPRFVIGEQLKEMAQRDPLCAELLARDLKIKEMNLAAAEKRFSEYAGKNRGKANVFCVTPAVAEKLLREFYGLPAPGDPDGENGEAHKADFAKSEDQTGYIDLSSFL